MLKQKDELIKANNSSNLRAKSKKKCDNYSDFLTPANAIHTNNIGTGVSSVKNGPKISGLTYLQISLKQKAMAQSKNNLINFKPTGNAIQSNNPPMLVDIKNNPQITGETPRKPILSTNNIGGLKQAGHHTKSITSANGTNKIKYQCPEQIKIPLVNNKLEKIEKSFESLSSVTINYDGLLNSDADFLMDSCVDTLLVKQGNKKVMGNNNNAGNLKQKEQQKIEPIKVFINENYYDVLKGLTENENERENINPKRPPVKSMKSVISPQSKEHKSSAEKIGKIRQNGRKSVIGIAPTKKLSDQTPKNKEPLVIKAVLKNEPKQLNKSRQKGRNKTIATTRSGKYMERGVPVSANPSSKALDKSAEHAARKNIKDKVKQALNQENLDEKKRSHSAQSRINRMRDERKMARNMNSVVGDITAIPFQDKLNMGNQNEQEIDRHCISLLECNLNMMNGIKCPVTTARPDQTPKVQISIAEMKKAELRKNHNNTRNYNNEMLRGASVEEQYTKLTIPAIPCLSPKIPYFSILIIMKDLK